MIHGYILSYNNPDTDSVCSSIAYYYYLKQKNEIFIPIIKGNIASETVFVLNAAKISVPIFNGEMDITKKFILIDTHNLSQLPHLPSVDKVIEILDHHPDGDVHIYKNAKITNKKIGAVASIIAEKYLNDNCMNKPIAILLGSAIISNTVNFTAPSTTSFDKKIFEKIKQYYTFENDYISLMFKSKNNILKHSLFDVLLSDAKDYIVKNYNIRISQLELADVYKNICFDDIINSMQIIMKNDKMKFYVVSLIDVVNLKTYILASDKNSIKLVQLIFNQNICKHVYEFNRVLLRKTDIIPKLNNAIQNIECKNKR